MSTSKGSQLPSAGLAAFGTVLVLAAGMVMKWEGYKADPYLDSVNVLTVCYGTTQNVQRRTYSRAECEAYLARDLAEARKVVHACVTAPMLPHQEAALISFAYNVGPGREGVRDGLCRLKNGKQPQIRQKANAGDWVGACAEFSNWTRAGGKRLLGLERRRADERRLCEGRV